MKSSGGWPGLQMSSTFHRNQRAVTKALMQTPQLRPLRARHETSSYACTFGNEVIYLPDNLSCFCWAKVCPHNTLRHLKAKLNTRELSFHVTATCCLKKIGSMWNANYVEYFIGVPSKQDINKPFTFLIQFLKIPNKGNTSFRPVNIIPGCVCNNVDNTHQWVLFVGSSPNLWTWLTI